MLCRLPSCTIPTRLWRLWPAHLLAAACLLLTIPGQLQAQGLIWSLPDDGAWVRYEGTYQQDQIRAEAGEGNTTLDWIRHLTIKSVGRESAEYQDVDGQKKTGPCRWIEIKVVTGKKGTGEIDAGEVGERIYKVLVPEERVVGKLADAKGIPVAYLPIVKGFRRSGDPTKPPVPIDVKSLNIFPAISLLRHYRSLKSESDQPEDLQVGAGAVSAKKLVANVQLESPTSRSIHTAELWRSDQVPFGLARWIVNIQKEEKAETQARSDFTTISKTTVEMTAQETGTDATSELVTP